MNPHVHFKIWRKPATVPSPVAFPVPLRIIKSRETWPLVQYHLPTMICLDVLHHSQYKLHLRSEYAQLLIHRLYMRSTVFHSSNNSRNIILWNWGWIWKVCSNPGKKCINEITALQILLWVLEIMVQQGGWNFLCLSQISLHVYVSVMESDKY